MRASPCYTKLLSHAYPLSSHSSYTLEQDYSDKIVVPLSVYYELTHSEVPFPPILLILPQKPGSRPVYCSIREYTAEEGHIYIPLRILQELKYDTGASDSHGVYLQSAQVKPFDIQRGFQYVMEECYKLTLYMKAPLPIDFVRKALSNYSVVKEKTQIEFEHDGNIVPVLIIDVQPTTPCSILKKYFSIEITETLPEWGRIGEFELNKRPVHRIALKNESNFSSPKRLKQSRREFNSFGLSTFDLSISYKPSRRDKISNRLPLIRDGRKSELLDTNKPFRKLRKWCEGKVSHTPSCHKQTVEEIQLAVPRFRSQVYNYNIFSRYRRVNRNYKSTK